MRNRSISLDGVLTHRKELVRLIIVAACLAFGVSSLSSVFVAAAPSSWIVLIAAGALILLPILILCVDLFSSLKFRDTAEAVLFYDCETREVLAARDYRFSESLATTMRAVTVESKSLDASWQKGLLPPREKNRESLAVQMMPRR